MDCEKANGLMMKYMDGVLTDGEAVLLNRHILTCGGCGEDFLAYDKLMDDFSEMTLAEPPEDFECRVMALIRQLPETGLKAVNRSLYGVLGVFSVLAGLGFFLDVNKNAMLNWMRQYPQLKPLFRVITPASDAIGSASAQISAVFSHIASFVQQAGASLKFVPLLLFGVLAAVQIVIYGRDRVAGK